MITELVLFALPEGMTREQVTAFFQQNAPKWRANPDLIRKNYLYDPEARRGLSLARHCRRAAGA
jgi:hypothetical protein